MAPSSEPGLGSFLGLGIEIGGTKLQLGLGRGDGLILALERRTIEPARGAAGILTEIADAFRVLVTRQRIAPGTIAAVGIGFGGPVDTTAGRVVTSYQVKGWDDFPLAGWVREHLGVARVALQNDADTAGLGESRFGAGIGCSPVLYVTIGSGIGGGLIFDGQIYRGAGAGALEIGHLRVVDRACDGHEPANLEDVASGWAITRAARQVAERHEREGRGVPWKVLELVDGDLSRINPAIVAEAARLGDSQACLILTRATRAIAFALDQAVTLLGPRRIILGGGVSLIGEEQWFQPIRTELARHVFAPFRASYDLVPASLGEAVVIHGALALASDLVIYPSGSK
jgi:glucokinase